MKRCNKIENNYTHKYTVTAGSLPNNNWNILLEIPEFREKYNSKATIYDNGYIEILYNGSNKVFYYVLGEEDNNISLNEIYPDISIFDSYNKITTPALVRRVNLEKDPSSNKYFAKPDYSIVIGGNICSKVEADKIVVDGGGDAIKTPLNNGFFQYSNGLKITKLIYSYKQSYIIYFYDSEGKHKRKTVKYYEYNDTNKEGYILNLGNIEYDDGADEAFTPKYLEVR